MCSDSQGVVIRFWVKIPKSETLVHISIITAQLYLTENTKKKTTKRKLIEIKIHKLIIKGTQTTKNKNKNVGHNTMKERRSHC